MDKSMKWQEYQEQVYKEFRKQYPKEQILYDQKLLGRYSKVKRQIDILVKAKMTGYDAIGIFDSKCFNKRVDVKIIDMMFGFIDDIGANFGGVVSAKGFTEGAINRARAANIDLRAIPFESPETVVKYFVPKLDFLDPRNSMYVGLL